MVKKTISIKGELYWKLMQNAVLNKKSIGKYVEDVLEESIYPTTREEVEEYLQKMTQKLGYRPVWGNITKSILVNKKDGIPVKCKIQGLNL